MHDVQGKRLFCFPQPPKDAFFFFCSCRSHTIRSTHTFNTTRLLLLLLLQVSHHTDSKISSLPSTCYLMEPSNSVHIKSSTCQDLSSVKSPLSLSSFVCVEFDFKKPTRLLLSGFDFSLTSQHLLIRVHGLVASCSGRKLLAVSIVLVNPL